MEAVRHATTRCILRDSLQTRPGRLISYAKVGAPSCHENVRTIGQNRNRIIANHILPRSKAEDDNDDDDREDISSSLSCREYFSPVNLLASVAAL